MREQFLVFFERTEGCLIPPIKKSGPNLGGATGWFCNGREMIFLEHSLEDAIDLMLSRKFEALIMTSDFPFHVLEGVRLLDERGDKKGKNEQTYPRDRQENAKCR